MPNEISSIRTNSLPAISPFSVDYSTAKLVSKISKNEREYKVVEVVVSTLGVETQTKYNVAFFPNEYKSIVSLGHDLDGIIASESLNQKTGAVTNIYTRWVKVQKEIA